MGSHAVADHEKGAKAAAAAAALDETTNACQTRAGAATGDVPVRLVGMTLAGCRTSPEKPRGFAPCSAPVRWPSNMRLDSGARAIGQTDHRHAGRGRQLGDEGSYLLLLQAAGYPLRIREPGWHQHRMFNGPNREINLRVFSVGSPNRRALSGSDQLRRNPADCDLYDTTKRRLASRQWEDVQSSAEAESNVIETILAGRNLRLNNDRF